MAVTTVGLAEAKNKLSGLIGPDAQGEEITITRHDEAVAKLVPAKRTSRVVTKSLALTEDDVRMKVRALTQREASGLIKKLLAEDFSFFTPSPIAPTGHACKHRVSSRYHDRSPL